MRNIGAGDDRGDGDDGGSRAEQTRLRIIMNY